MQHPLPIRGALEVMTMTLTMDDFGYWSLRVSVRDGATKSWRTDTYEGLTAGEAQDVLAGYVEG